MANDVLCVLESWRAMPPLRDCAEGDALDGSPTEDGSPVARMDRDSLCGLPCAGASAAVQPYLTARTAQAEMGRGAGRGQTQRTQHAARRQKQVRRGTAQRQVRRGRVARYICMH